MVCADATKFNSRSTPKGMTRYEIRRMDALARRRELEKRRQMSRFGPGGIYRKSVCRKSYEEV